MEIGNVKHMNLECLQFCYLLHPITSHIPTYMAPLVTSLRAAWNILGYGLSEAVAGSNSTSNVWRFWVKQFIISKFQISDQTFNAFFLSDVVKVNEIYCQIK